MNENGEIITEDFEREYKECVRFYAEANLQGGGVMIPQSVLNVKRKMESKGISYDTFQEDVETETSRIREEKAKRRKDDAWGYKTAKEAYIRALRRKRLEPYSYPMGDPRNEEEINRRENGLSVAATELHEYEEKWRIEADEWNRLENWLIANEENLEKYYSGAMLEAVRIRMQMLQLQKRLEEVGKELGSGSPSIYMRQIVKTALERGIGLEDFVQAMGDNSREKITQENDKIGE